MKASDQGEGAGENMLKSAMPGTITKVFRKVGDVIKKGEAVIAMEAMKMETVMRAAFDCKVVKVTVGEKDFVEAGKTLVEL